MSTSNEGLLVLSAVIGAIGLIAYLVTSIMS